MAYEDQERIAILESDVTEIKLLVSDLHDDMISRRARWHFINGALRIGIWIAGGLASLFGLKAANWLGMFPHDG